MKKAFINIIAPCLLIGIGLFIGATEVVALLGQWEAEEQAVYLVEELGQCEEYNRKIAEEAIKTSQYAQKCVEALKAERAKK